MATAQTDQSDFANTIAAYLGYDPRVVYAWTQQETGGQAIGNNWLNLRPASNEVGVVGTTTGGFAKFDNLKDATISTEHVLKQSNMSLIVQEGGPGHTLSDEIGGIAASPWDSGPAYDDSQYAGVKSSTHHYGYGGPGGPNLVARFNDLYPGGKITSPPSSHVVTGSGSQTQSSVWDWLTGVPNSKSGNPINSVSDAIGAIAGFLFSYRFLEILGGGLFLLLGLYLLSKQFGNTLGVPKPPAADAFEQGFGTGDRQVSRSSGRREATRRASGTSATTEANLAGQRAERATANL